MTTRLTAAAVFGTGLVRCAISSLTTNGPTGHRLETPASLSMPTFSTLRTLIQG